MAWYDDPVTITAVAVVIIIACGIVIFAMRKLGNKPQQKKPQKTDNDPLLNMQVHPSESPKASKHQQLLTQKMNCGCSI